MIMDINDIYYLAKLLYSTYDFDFADHYTESDIFYFIATAYVLWPTNVEVTHRQENTPTLIISKSRVSVIYQGKRKSTSSWVKILPDFAESYGVDIEDDITNLLSYIQLAMTQAMLDQ